MPSPLQPLNTYIDHTLLRPDATETQIRKLCAEADTHQFAAVCVPPCYVNLAFELLNNTRVNVASVVGFPLGYTTFTNKVNECHDVIARGANEIDAVLNIAALKTGNTDFVFKELMALSDVCKAGQAKLKVIIETALLTPAEIEEACQLCAQAGADMVKTSTGFASRGATLADVQLMRRVLPEKVKIKAAGGIKTYTLAKQLIEAGADRIGTSSGLQLMEEWHLDS